MGVLPLLQLLLLGVLVVLCPSRIQAGVVPPNLPVHVLLQGQVCACITAGRMHVCQQRCCRLATFQQGQQRMGWLLDTAMLLLDLVLQQPASSSSNRHQGSSSSRHSNSRQRNAQQMR